MSFASHAYLPPAFRFGAMFAVLALGGMILSIVEPVDRNVLIPFTEELARLSAAVINFCGGGASSVGHRLSLNSGCGRVTVEDGCNAVQISIVLAAAIFAFPAPVFRRLIGALAGVCALQAINLVRIVSLLYLSCYSARWFEFFHLYLWDAMILLDGVVFFLSWLHWQTDRRPA